MKRHVYKGWVPKSYSADDFFGVDKSDNQYWFGAEMFRTKGRRDDYNDEDWPPVRVKITVEVED